MLDKMPILIDNTSEQFYNNNNGNNNDGNNDINDIYTDKRVLSSDDVKYQQILNVISALHSTSPQEIGDENSEINLNGKNNEKNKNSENDEKKENVKNNKNNENKPTNEYNESNGSIGIHYHINVQHHTHSKLKLQDLDNRMNNNSNEKLIANKSENESKEEISENKNGNNGDEYQQKNEKNSVKNDVKTDIKYLASLIDTSPSSFIEKNDDHIGEYWR